MEQLVARRAHNPKVVGSSPAPATERFKSNKGMAKTTMSFFVYKFVAGSEKIKCGHILGTSIP